jgi:hypothetical protein
MVIPAAYQIAQPFAERLAAVKTKGLYGYIDQSGRMVIPPQFEVAHPFSEGLAAVRLKGKLGYISPRGEFVIPPQFLSTGGFHNGLAPVRVGDKFGYIDKSGNMKIAPAYSTASQFFEGVAAVSQGNKWGLVKASGEWSVQPNYDFLGHFDILGPREFASHAVKDQHTVVMIGEAHGGAIKLTTNKAAEQLVSIQFQSDPVRATVYRVPTTDFEDMGEDTDYFLSQPEYLVNRPTNCLYYLKPRMHYWVFFQDATKTKLERRFCRPLVDAPILKVQFSP